ncbi:MAG TPA: M14 family zinc carboxypeptidase, partial [Kofleriaceae bacterium]|nr:M14 family zinc carboxypeptidase [Kofleriaceae bacterium]
MQARASLPWVGLAAVFAATVLAASPDPRVAIRIDESPLAESVALDIWSEHRGPGRPLDIVVRESDLVTLAKAGFAWEILDPDIDATAAAEAARLASPQAQRPGDWFADYKDNEQIGTYLQTLALARPDLASLHVIGGSVEGRPILALRIGKGTPMLVNGTQHAREWIATMVTTCVADRLVRRYNSDPRVKAFVDSTELWVVPVVNPDGYQFAWGSDRYWRKNRRDRHGVDLNRNWGLAWGGSGASRNKRSETYRGEYAFSEPETQAIRDLAKREQIRAHVDFHAYGELLLYPWSYTGAAAPDRARYRAVGDRLASAMYAEHEHRYVLQAGADLYAAAGTATDWAYGDAQAMSFTIELRPGGRRGAR